MFNEQAVFEIINDVITKVISGAILLLIEKGLLKKTSVVRNYWVNKKNTSCLTHANRAIA